MGAVVGRSDSVWFRGEWGRNDGQFLLVLFFLLLCFSVFKLVRVSLNLKVDLSGFYMRVFKSSI